MSSVCELTEFKEILGKCFSEKRQANTFFATKFAQNLFAHWSNTNKRRSLFATTMSFMRFVDGRLKQDCQKYCASKMKTS